MNREALLACARFHHGQYEALCRTWNERDKVAAERERLVALALREVAAGESTEREALDLFRSRWASFAAAQQAKVDAGRPVPRGPRSGGKYNDHLVATAAGGEQGELDICRAVYQAEQAP